MSNRRICGEANVRTSWISFNAEPKRNVPPNALMSAGRMLAGFFAFVFVKFTLADDFLNAADEIPFAGSTCVDFATDLFQYLRKRGDTSVLISSGFIFQRSLFSNGLRKPLHTNESNHWKNSFDGKLAPSSGQGMSGFSYFVSVASPSTKKLSSRIKALMVKKMMKLM